MNHASLFSGIGGFDLAAEWRGWTNVFSCEKDDKANAVLEKRFPNVTHYRDIFELDAKKYEGQIDIITGGFPCQPFSVAGKRKGTEDERHLWPEMLRIIRECKPTYVVGENVFGLTNMDNGKTLESIYLDLESEGYTVESFIIPACAVQAWHRRDRIWIIAYSDNGNERRASRRLQEKDGERQLSKQQQVVQSGSTSETRIHNNAKRSNAQGQRLKRHEEREYRGLGGKQDVTDTKSERLEGWEEPRHTGTAQSRFRKSRWSIKGIWELEPNVGRVANGIPGRVDRLKQLGNAIVPQVAYEIFKILDDLK